MALIDLDHFKRVNDTYGHFVGDDVLQAVAGAMRVGTRPYDAVGRWGGEEFLIVCPETNELHAFNAIERLAKLGLGNLPDGTPQTASIGVAEWNPSSSSCDPSALVKSADKRMYQAKQAGRNHIAMSNGQLRELLPNSGAPLPAAQGCAA